MTWIQTTNLKFCLLNAENLFLLFDSIPGTESLNLKETQWQRLSTSVLDNKPLKKTREIAQALVSIDADIIMLCEVGGLESLKNFNSLFLQDHYIPLLIEGNSDRNIDVGFLVRKNLPFHFELQSNKNRPINYLYPHERESLAAGYTPIKNGKPLISHKFSRDVAELRLFTANKEKPFLILLLAHLKSRLDPERIDPNGFERRKAELRTLLEIYNEIKVVHPDLPIIVAGDFNGNASKKNADEEFKDIYSLTGLIDSLELAGLEDDAKATYYQVKTGSRVDGKQIDYAFLSPEAQNLLKLNSAHVHRYKDEFGLQYGVPNSMDSKGNLPSDHYPVVFELENIRLK